MISEPFHPPAPSGRKLCISMVPISGRPLPASASALALAEAAVTRPHHAPPPHAAIRSVTLCLGLVHVPTGEVTGGAPNAGAAARASAARSRRVIAR